MTESQRSKDGARIDGGERDARNCRWLLRDKAEGLRGVRTSKLDVAGRGERKRELERLKRGLVVQKKREWLVVWRTDKRDA